MICDYFNFMYFLMFQEVQKHSVHTLVFRSLKRTHDMFLSDQGTLPLRDEKRFEKNINCMIIINQAKWKKVFFIVKCYRSGESGQLMSYISRTYLDILVILISRTYLDIFYFYLCLCFAR